MIFNSKINVFTVHMMFDIVKPHLGPMLSEKALAAPLSNVQHYCSQ